MGWMLRAMGGPGLKILDRVVSTTSICEDLIDLMAQTELVEVITEIKESVYHSIYQYILQI